MRLLRMWCIGAGAFSHGLQCGCRSGGECAGAGSRVTPRSAVPRLLWVFALPQWLPYCSHPLSGRRGWVAGSAMRAGSAPPTSTHPACPIPIAESSPHARARTQTNPHRITLVPSPPCPNNAYVHHTPVCVCTTVPHMCTAIHVYVCPRHVLRALLTLWPPSWVACTAWPTPWSTSPAYGLSGHHRWQEAGAVRQQQVRRAGSACVCLCVRARARACVRG